MVCDLKLDSANVSECDDCLLLLPHNQTRCGRCLIFYWQRHCMFLFIQNIFEWFVFFLVWPQIEKQIDTFQSRSVRYNKQFWLKDVLLYFKRKNRLKIVINLLNLVNSYCQWTGAEAIFTWNIVGSDNPVEQVYNYALDIYTWNPLDNPELHQTYLQLFLISITILILISVILT